MDARIALPRSQTINGWMAVADGKIVGLGESLPPAARNTIRCGGLLVIPGLIDLHVHFRDPGNIEKEDFITGSLAAAFGGVTTVVDMPDQKVPTIRPADVREKISHLTGRSFVDFALYAELSDSAEFIDELSDLGVVGLKWMLGYDPLVGTGRVSRAALRRALHAAAQVNMLVGVHAESPIWILDLTEDLVSRGRTDVRAHGESRPDFVEAAGVAEAVIVGAESGCRLHIHHLSSKWGLETALDLRGRLSKGLTIETCPQYLFLNDDDVSQLGSVARVNPPIKSEQDRQALWAGIVSGDIDCVATDHAPHLATEKIASDIWKAQSGLLGVETLFSLMFHTVQQERMTLGRFVEVTAERPAMIAGLSSKGRLFPGYDADFLLVDPLGSTHISATTLHSKSPITVYDGWDRLGQLVGVYLRGECVVDRGQLVGLRRGKHLRSTH